MSGKESKTNPNRLRGQHRSHFCPTCDAPAKFHMHMPGNSMWGHCEKGHAHRKTELILR